MERELKLEFAAEDAASLARAPALDLAEASERRLVATYFDTADEDLCRAGFTLRVRDHGGRHVQTVKAEGAAAAGLFVRPEWERAVPGPDPVIDEAAGPIAALVAGRALLPQFETDVRRRARVIDWEGARIEVALDEGEIRAGGRAQSLGELELELRDGPVPALFALARTLDEGGIPLRLGVLSKSERGRRLRDKASAGAAKAEPVALDREGDAVEAFAAIAQSCLRQFRLNEALLLGPDTGTAPLHQARVGLRRLRSALSLFRKLLADDAEAGRFAAELKSLAAVLGDVRDLDVLIERHEGEARDRLFVAREEAFACVRTRLEEAATRRLILDLAEWLALGDWRVRPADPALARQPISVFAADLLDRRRKRIKRRGGRLSRLDDHNRHQVRIEGKKLRYAAEFFAGLWTTNKAKRRRKRFAEAIEALQEELGALNDLSHGAAVLARLGLPVEEPGPDKVRQRLARAEAAYEELIEAKRFWR